MVCSIIKLMSKDIEVLENLIFSKNFLNAEILLKKLLKQEKNNSILYYYSTLIKLNLKKNEEALKEIETAINLNKSIKNLNLKVHILFLLEKFQEAIYVLDEIIKLDSRNALAYYFTAVAHHKINNKFEAIKFYKISLKYDPNSIPVLKNYVNLLVELKNFDLAIDCQSHIISLENRKDYISLNDRGVLFLRVQEFNRAILDFNEAIRINNQDSLVYFNLSKAYFHQKNFDLAFENIAISQELNPESDQINLLLAEIYIQKKKPVLAIEQIKKIKKHNLNSIVNLIYQKLEVSDWSTYEKIIKELKKNINCFENGILLSAFCSLLLEDNPSFQLDVAKNVSKYIEDKAKEIKIKDFVYKSPNKKIRLGYISSDFNNHPMGHLLKSFFKNHNRNLFEVVGFNIGKKNSKDNFFLEIKNSFDVFINCNELSDKDLILKIRKMDIDIAIDLMGYTENCRPLIFAKRVAPIQINYLGYPGTLGSNFIDYILADQFIIPPAMKKFYSEKVLYLPDCYQINDDTKKIENFYKNRSDVGLPENDFIYACFNKNLKINPLIFNCWMKILKKTPNSLLWLWVKDQNASYNLLEEAKKFNIDSKRIIFANKVPLERHLSRYKFIDLFLDSYPYTSHVTASDCLFAETPLLSICGQSFASRVSSSLLNNLNLNELISYSLDEYQDKAINLYQNRFHLRYLKQRLIENKKISTLFKTKIKTKQIEDIYLKIIKN